MARSTPFPYDYNISIDRFDFPNYVVVFINNHVKNGQLIRSIEIGGFSGWICCKQWSPSWFNACMHIGVKQHKRKIRARFSLLCRFFFLVFLCPKRMWAKVIFLPANERIRKTAQRTNESKERLKQNRYFFLIRYNNNQRNQFGLSLQLHCTQRLHSSLDYVFEWFNRFHILILNPAFSVK